MSDVEHSRATRAHAFDQRKQPSGLGIRKGRRRLVEDEAARGADSGARDLDYLPLAEPQRRDRRVEWQVGAKRIESTLRQLAHGAEVDESHPVGQRAEGDVLGDGQRRRIGDLLGNQLYAGAARLGDGAERNRGTVDGEGSLVLMMVAGKDADQGGLAGAVLAQKSGNRARGQVKVHAMEDLDRAERLSDSANGEKDRLAHGQQLVSG